MLEMLEISLNWQPGLILLLAGFAAVFLPQQINRLLLIIAPAVALLHWLLLPSATEQTHLAISNTFALAFILVSLLVGIYSYTTAGKMEQVAALIYAGSTISVLYASSYLTFFIYFEITAISSVFVVWAGREPETYSAGMRYLVFQLIAGAMLLMGIVGNYHEHGDFVIRAMDLSRGYEWFFLGAFGIKAAFTFMHMWLPDAYPASSSSGSAVLSAFTTKMAIYALLIHFTGQPLLIFIGCLMAIWPMLYMSLANDTRRIIAYALQNQFGYMVVAIGLGTDLAINGAVAHAFACTIYGALLYMTTGALLHTNGTTRCHILGGLANKQRLLFGLTLVAVFTIAAFPFFSGFASKSLTLSALSKAEFAVPWLILMISSVAVIDALAFKIPYQVFIKEPKQASVVTDSKPIALSMKVAMIATAVVCILPGIFPNTYYQLLPYSSYWDYELNTAEHLITQYQLIVMTFIGYLVFKFLKLYPNQYPQALLDADIVYRRWLPELSLNIRSAYRMFTQWCRYSHLAVIANGWIKRSEAISIANAWPTGSMVVWVAIILVTTLFLYFV